jgi:hypothetical protein
VTELGPVAFYRCGISNARVVLFDETAHRHDGVFVVPPKMVPWGADREHGIAMRSGGPEAPVYGVVDPFPKTETQALSVCALVYAESHPRWASTAKNWTKESGINQGGEFHFGLHRDDGD